MRRRAFFRFRVLIRLFIGEFEVVSAFVQCFLLRENSLLYSTQNTDKVNSDKCKEIRISFVKDEPQFTVVVGNQLQRVTGAKILGLTISSDLTWN